VGSTWFREDRPIMGTHAETGEDMLHQEAAGARPIDLGVFDNEFEIADLILLWIVLSSLHLSMSCVALGLPWAG
jgi:hypothetical protein